MSTSGAGPRSGCRCPDASVDVVHARWAYFFGPGCEPGLRELARVLRRGGAAFVIDNDADALDVRRLVPARLARLRRRRRWSGSGPGRAGPGRRSTDALGLRRRGRIRGRRPDRVRAALADEILAEHAGTEVDYAVNLFWRTA